MTPKTRVIVADAGRARVFDVVEDRSGSGLVEGTGMVHDKSRLADREILTDRPGRVRTGMGGHAVTAMSPRTDPKELEAEHFAAHIADALETAHRAGEFEMLVLAAPPHFLGLLRKSMRRAVSERVGATVTLDGIRMKVEQLQSSLAKALATARDVALERQGWPWAEPVRH
jgi:protein required for attachment to host cells